MKFDSILFRCSSLGHIMTDARSGNALSETCKTHLIDVYVSNKYGRNTDISNKYIQKGLMVEEDSITLYSRVKKKFFKKNDTHLTNNYIKGTPDLFTGADITIADEIIDTKSSWDIYTFFRTYTQPLNKMYYWQLQAYMALSGARSSRLGYCLVNTPETLIDDEKRKLFYKMNAGTDENPDYIEACKELEKAMVYDDIPLKDRVHEFIIDRDEDAIQKIYNRVVACREYLNELEEKMQPSELASIIKMKPKPFEGQKATAALDASAIPLIKI